MHKRFLQTASLLGALSVILGAFAAHTLKKHISEAAVQIFETAVRYQFYHVFALLSVGVLYKEFPNKLLRWSGISFTAGIIIFCGSLYCLTYIKAAELTAFDWVGAITPLGGLSFILGWIFLFSATAKKPIKSHKSLEVLNV
ncbi:DUF423 domain-containing protein [soil metagenome]